MSADYGLGVRIQLTSGINHQRTFSVSAVAMTSMLAWVPHKLAHKPGRTSATRGFVKTKPFIAGGFNA